MTVLDGITTQQVTRDPYPHLVVENAVDEDLCRALVNHFPPLAVFTGGRRFGDNVKMYYSAQRAAGDARVAPIWKSFLNDHLTPAFYQQVLRVFRPFLVEEHPGLELDALRLGVQGRDGFDTCDILLNASLGIHTRVAGQARLERKPHVKDHDKFLEGFLYLRPDDDQAEGGDYEFFSVRHGARPRFERWAQTDRDCLNLERTVPYRKNTLVMVVNTRRSIQALTARGPGQRPLMYFNLTVRTPRRLFDLDYTLAGQAHRFLRGHHVNRG